MIGKFKKVHKSDSSRWVAVCPFKVLHITYHFYIEFKIFNHTVVLQCHGQQLKDTRYTVKGQIRYQIMFVISHGAFRVGRQHRHGDLIDIELCWFYWLSGFRFFHKHQGKSISHIFDKWQNLGCKHEILSYFRIWQVDWLRSLLLNSPNLLRKKTKF